MKTAVHFFTVGRCKKATFTSTVSAIPKIRLQIAASRKRSTFCDVVRQLIRSRLGVAFENYLVGHREINFCGNAEKMRGKEEMLR